MPPTTGYSFGDVVRRLGQLTTEDQQALRNAIAKIVG